MRNSPKNIDVLDRFEISRDSVGWKIKLRHKTLPVMVFVTKGATYYYWYFTVVIDGEMHYVPIGELSGKRSPKDISDEELNLYVLKISMEANW